MVIVSPCILEPRSFPDRSLSLLNMSIRTKYLDDKTKLSDLFPYFTWRTRKEMQPQI